MSFCVMTSVDSTIGAVAGNVGFLLAAAGVELEVVES